jgi:hypothetical protein
VYKRTFTWHSIWCCCQICLYVDQVACDADSRQANIVFKDYREPGDD